MCAQVHGIEHEVPAAQLRFPGGQPVSLDRANLGKLREKRYWVTWKADGTRYMLLLCKWGVYLIDRSFNVRRVQVSALLCLQLHALQGQLGASLLTCTVMPNGATPITLTSMHNKANWSLFSSSLTRANHE